MNTQLQTLPAEPTQVGTPVVLPNEPVIPSPVPPPATDSSDANLQPAISEGQPASSRSYRPKGKIASLPKAQRDTINRLLLDGATYPSVIRAMAEQGVSLNAENLSNWHQGGYQAYLAELDRADYHHAKLEAAAAFLDNTDPCKLPEAGLQTAAAQIYDLLGQLAPADFIENIAGDPDQYTRLVNSLSRLTREIIHLQQQRDAATARQAQCLDPKRDLAEVERDLILDKADEILGAKAYRRRPPTPNHPNSSATI